MKKLNFVFSGFICIFISGDILALQPRFLGPPVSQDHGLQTTPENILEFFIQAAEKGNVQQVQSLIDQGMDVNASNPQGYTALHYAVLRNQQPIVKMLLAAGADPNKTNQFDITPFEYSFWMGNPNLTLTQLLLSYGGNVNRRDRLGYTPLFRAATFKNLQEILKLLIDHGADVNAQAFDSSTPLHEAAARGNKEAVTLLLAHGAKKDQKTRDGQTAADYARITDHKDIALFLDQK